MEGAGKLKIYHHVHATAEDIQDEITNRLDTRHALGRSGRYVRHGA